MSFAANLAYSTYIIGSSIIFGLSVSGENVFTFLTFSKSTKVRYKAGGDTCNKMLNWGLSLSSQGENRC